MMVSAASHTGDIVGDCRAARCQHCKT
jgi:hypothetical protein